MKISGIIFFAITLLITACNSTIDNKKSQDSFYIKPFVTKVSSNTAKIIWVDDNTNPIEVRIKAHKNLSALSEISKFKDIKNILHIASLKDLNPSTKYIYIIETKKGKFSGSFKTAPIKDTPLNFVIYGDTRTRYDKHKEVADRIALDNPDFVLCSGDLVSNGEIWPQWKKEFFDPAFSYLNKSVIWPIRGNHEGNAYYYSKLFNIKENEEYYSFDYGNLHIIVLDQLIPQSNYDEMYEWVKNDLKNNKSMWTIVSYHIPTFNIGGHGSKWGRERFLPLFELFGVDIIITGHSHLYERFKPISATGKKPIIHIVSGGGGAPTYPPKANPLIEGNIGKDVLHHCNFKIDGNKLTMKAIQSNGVIIDEFSLIKENGTYQKEILEEALNLEEAERLISIFGNMNGDFTPALARKGKKILVEINDVGFEEDSTVVIKNDEANSFWNIKKQECVVKNKKLSFYATPTENINVGINGYDKPFSMKMDFTDKGKEFNNYRVLVSVSNQTLLKCIPSPQIVSIPNAKIKVDGDISEWKDIEPIYMPFERKASDEIKFAWNNQGIFICLNVIDSSINVNELSLHSLDAFELFVDKKFSRGAELNPDCFQLVFAPNKDKRQAITKFNFKDIGLNTKGILTEWRKTEEGYLMEIFLPASLMSYKNLKPNMLIGLNFSLNNEGKARFQYNYDKNKDDSYKRPITWGAIKLQ